MGLCFKKCVRLPLDAPVQASFPKGKLSSGRNDALNNPRCDVCGGAMKENGHTKAGTKRWWCKSCGYSKTRRIDNAAKLLRALLSWLLFKRPIAPSWDATGRPSGARPPGSGSSGSSLLSPARSSTRSFWTKSGFPATL